MDPDLRSVQQARDLLRQAHNAQKTFATAGQEQVERTGRIGAGRSRWA